MMRILSGNPGTDDLLAPLVINAGISVAILAASMALTQNIADRHS